MGRSEAALSVLLALTIRLLVAFVDGTPLAGACDVHSFFDAKLITAPSAYTASTGWLFAVALMPDTHASAGGLTSVDVVSAITCANRLEHARTVTTGRTWHAPVLRGVRREVGRRRVALRAIVARGPWNRHASVADEAIVR